MNTGTGEGEQPPPVDSGQQLLATMAAVLQQLAQQNGTTRPSLPDVAPFRGDKRDFRAWLPRMRTKLDTDSNLYRKEQMKCAYIESRLEGVAAQKMSPFFKRFRDGGALHDAQATFRELEAAFKDPHLERDAFVKLQNLKQKKGQHFRDFVDEVESLAADAAADTSSATDCTTLTAILENNMLPGLREKLIPIADDLVDLRRDWPAYTKKVGSIAKAWELTGAKNPFGSQQAASSSSGPDLMDWEPTLTQMAAQIAQLQAGGLRTRGRQGRERSTPASERRAKWVNPEVIEQRRRDRLCLRCGDGTHFISRCPYRAPRRPPSAAAGPNASNVHAAPLLEDEGESTSGKVEPLD